MYNKVIVTNLSALTAKYKAKTSKITAAVNKMIAADKTKGLSTLFISLDDKAAMKKLPASPVTNPKDPRQNKIAIDAVYKAFVPDYLVILGSVDVIPHQDMRNPVYHPGDDDDVLADGDLPYACDASYSKNPEAFVGPTRVVGRLPDLTGANDPTYLVDLLKTATDFKSLTAKDYSEYFSISAAVWEGSTRMSLDNIFGANDKLNLSPKKGPAWSKSVLSKKIHFINCHGAPATPQFFGQFDQDYPTSHDAALLKDKVAPGSVVAAECCYGAELYDSILLGGGQMGICYAYLAGKACGFFGSTTIAYGPADGNGSADLICQYFLKSVLRGASLGRAALEARQKFVSATPNMDPIDLKTLAQFNLLGDPSLCPIAAPPPQSPSKTTKSFLLANDIERTERRQQLHSRGSWLAKNQPVAQSTSAANASPDVRSTMKKIAAKFEMRDSNIMSFGIRHAAPSASSFAKGMSPSSFHVVIGEEKPKKGEEKPLDGKTAAGPAIRRTICVVAKEVNGQIVSFRELQSK